MLLLSRLQLDTPVRRHHLAIKSPTAMEISETVPIRQRSQAPHQWHLTTLRRGHTIQIRSLTLRAMTSPEVCILSMKRVSNCAQWEHQTAHVSVQPSTFPMREFIVRTPMARSRLTLTQASREQQHQLNTQYWTRTVNSPQQPLLQA